MLHYRKIGPDDGDALSAHLLRLRPADRAARFMAQVGDDRIRAHVRALRWRSMIALGGFDDGTLRAVAELHLGPARPLDAAEIAITVEAPWQGLGIGREMLGRLIVFARNRALGSLHMICLTDNMRMRRIARRFGSQLVLADGEAHARLRLPFPDALTLMTELVGDGNAALRRLARRPAA